MTLPREILIEALQDVEAAKTPDDLREIAFAKVFDLRAGTSAGPAPTVPAPQTGTKSSSPTAARHAEADDPLGQIAARLALDREIIEEVFTLNEGQPELIVPTSKLSSKTATATKEIAVLMAGSRQAAGLEEWTSWDVIRATCADFKKLDAGNFAKTIREMDDVFNFRRDSERKLSVKMAKPGWDHVAHMIRKLGGD